MAYFGDTGLNDAGLEARGQRRSLRGVVTANRRASPRRFGKINRQAVGRFVRQVPWWTIAQRLAPGAGSSLMKPGIDRVYEAQKRYAARGFHEADDGLSALDASFWSRLKQANRKVLAVNKLALKKVSLGRVTGGIYRKSGVIGRIFTAPKSAKNIARLKSYKKIGKYAAIAGAVVGVSALVFFTGGAALAAVGPLFAGAGGTVGAFGSSIMTLGSSLGVSASSIPALAGIALKKVNEKRAAKGEPPVTAEQVAADPQLQTEMKYEMVKETENKKAAIAAGEEGSGGNQVQGSILDFIKSKFGGGGAEGGAGGGEASSAAPTAATATATAEAPVEQGMLGGIPPLGLALGALAVGAYFLNRKR